MKRQTALFLAFVLFVGPLQQAPAFEALYSYVPANEPGTLSYRDFRSNVSRLSGQLAKLPDAQILSRLESMAGMDFQDRAAQAKEWIAAEALLSVALSESPAKNLEAKPAGVALALGESWSPEQRERAQNIHERFRQRLGQGAIDELFDGSGRWRGRAAIELSRGALDLRVVSRPGSQGEVLSPELRQALKKADGRDFVVEVLRGKVTGRPRTVVLLGEKHYKSARASKIGVEILAHFKHRGVEGYNPKLAFGAKAVLFLLYNRVTRFVLAFLTAGLMANRSTIHDAKEKSAPKSGESNPAKPAIHRLEEGHRPDFAERMAFPAFLGFVAVEAARWISGLRLWRALWPALAFLAVLNQALDRTAQIWSWYLMAGVIIAPWVGRGLVSARARYLFPYPLGLEIGRNATMVANTLKVFKGHRSVRKLLDIVGKAHVPGMKTLLQKAGFVPVRL